MLTAARNQTLARLLESVYGQMHVLRLRTLHHAERVATSFAEHRRLHDALASRDADNRGAEAEIW